MEITMGDMRLLASQSFYIQMNQPFNVSLPIGDDWLKCIFAFGISELDDKHGKPWIESYVDKEKQTIMFNMYNLDVADSSVFNRDKVFLASSDENDIYADVVFQSHLKMGKIYVNLAFYVSPKEKENA